VLSDRGMELKVECKEVQVLNDRDLELKSVRKGI
jgi:hypothetical protein